MHNKDNLDLFRVSINTTRLSSSMVVFIFSMVRMHNLVTKISHYGFHASSDSNAVSQQLLHIKLSFRLWFRFTLPYGIYNKTKEETKRIGYQIDQTIHHTNLHAYTQNINKHHNLLLKLIYKQHNEVILLKH